MKLLILIAATLAALAWNWQLTAIYWAISIAMGGLYGILSKKIVIGHLITMSVMLAIVIGVISGNYIWVILVAINMLSSIPDKTKMNAFI